MRLPSGRLDLLFATGSSLLLVELKAEPATEQGVWQVLAYARDLHALQDRGELLRAPIVRMLAAPAIPKGVEVLCQSEHVAPLRFSPDTVLSQFFRQLPTLTSLMQLRPKDYGLWNRYLIHRVIYALSNGTVDPKGISRETGLSRASVMNHLRFAVDLHLVDSTDIGYALTDLGKAYVAARNPNMPPSEASEKQLSIIGDYVIRNPFGSPLFVGIYSIVNAVFDISRNSYPVTDDLLIPHFRTAVGKVSDWKSETSARYGTKMYSNYAVELGLLGRFGRTVYLTPDGLRFLLLLNLHKSMFMAETLGLTIHGGEDLW